MAAQFKQGSVIFRHWNMEDGLNEISRTFHSMNELFSLCLQTDNTLLVDRVVFEGEGGDGTPRTVTLVFQSTSIQDQPPT